MPYQLTCQVIIFQSVYVNVILARAIVGIVADVLVFIAFVVGGYFWYKRKLAKRQASSALTTASAPASTAEIPKLKPPVTCIDQICTGKIKANSKFYLGINCL